MRIRVKNPAADQDFTEYVMGIAEETVRFPGIAQCFGIVGLFGSRMLCVHVSPGTTEEEMDTIFANLNLMGGDNVLDWYIIGPFDEHFAVGSALWRSKKDIKKTFRQHFPKKARFHIMDVTAERSARVLFEGNMWPIGAIDVRVVRNSFSLAFAYKEGRLSVTTWTPLDLTKFKRL